MKGPHFFEKRKKEMARQEKLKQKAERKAQRKADKDRGGSGEVGENAAEFASSAEGDVPSSQEDLGEASPAREAGDAGGAPDRTDQDH